MISLCPSSTAYFPQKVLSKTLFLELQVFCFFLSVDCPVLISFLLLLWPSLSCPRFCNSFSLNWNVSWALLPDNTCQFFSLSGIYLIRNYYNMWEDRGLLYRNYYVHNSFIFGQLFMKLIVTTWVLWPVKMLLQSSMFKVAIDNLSLLI